MIDNSDLTDDELLATVALVGEWVEGVFPMDYFLDMVDSAVHKGYMYWGTQTDKSVEPQRNRVVFFKYSGSGGA